MSNNHSLKEWIFAFILVTSVFILMLNIKSSSSLLTMSGEQCDELNQSYNGDLLYCDDFENWCKCSNIKVFGLVVYLNCDCSEEVLELDMYKVDWVAWREL